MKGNLEMMNRNTGKTVYNEIEETDTSPRYNQLPHYSRNYDVFGCIIFKI